MVSKALRRHSLRSKKPLAGKPQCVPKAVRGGIYSLVRGRPGAWDEQGLGLQAHKEWRDTQHNAWAQHQGESRRFRVIASKPSYLPQKDKWLEGEYRPLYAYPHKSPPSQLTPLRAVGNAGSLVSENQFWRKPVNLPLRFLPFLWSSATTSAVSPSSFLWWSIYRGIVPPLLPTPSPAGSTPNTIYTINYVNT